MPRPHLFIVVDARDGRPLDAGLSADTKDYLRRLVQERASLKAEHQEVTEGQPQTDASIDMANPSDEPSTKQLPEVSVDSVNPVFGDQMALSSEGLMDNPRSTRRIEIPLTFDSEFFRLLSDELSVLDQLQEAEQAQLTESVIELGRMVSRSTAPHNSASGSDITTWRQIFELYVDAKIFFSTNERDHGLRSAAMAAKQLQWFSNEAAKRQLARNMKSKESAMALDQFSRLNTLLLRNLRFQELNQTATTKILKSTSNARLFIIHR